MPKISVDNYDTVASWNGNQDLLIVEQPDGTKVATPNMVKQFIEAGDFVATGEVEDGHGNVLKDMAKSADVDTLISQLNDKFKRLNNIKVIDEGFVIFFIGYSDVASRVLCPINFPFSFSDTDYSLSCSRIELVSVGTFTTGITVDTKFRSSALIILSRASAAGAVFVGRAHIHISRTE